ncbi:MAG: molecular chaperone TorD family protein [Bacteroidota bacterium]
MTNIETDASSACALARANIYGLLTKAFLHPTDQMLAYIQLPEHKANLMLYVSLAPQQGIEQPFEKLVASSRAASAGREKLDAEYHRLFAHLGSARCPPYETEYGIENVFQKTEAMADIAGFYRAFGLEVADKNRDRVDFIGTQLEFMKYLALNEAYGREQGERQQTDIAIDAQRKFLCDHLGRWAGSFSNTLLNNTENQFYRALGTTVHIMIDTDTELLGVDPRASMLSPHVQARFAEPFECHHCEATRRV